MAVGNGIVIRIGAEAGQAIREIQRVERALGRNLSVGERMGAMSRRAGLALGALGAAAGVAALSLGRDMVNAALEDEKALASLNRTLGNMGFAYATAEVDAFVSRLQMATGVSDSELRPAFDRLVRSTKDVGEAERLLEIAVNASASGQKSLSEVANALGKAYDGNTTALGRLGLGIDSATLKSGDLDAITARMAALFDGQAATAAATLSGRMGRVSEAAGEAGEAIGGALLRAADRLVTKVAGGNGTDSLVGAVTAAGDALADLVTGLGLAAEAAVDFLGKIRGATGNKSDGLVGFLNTAVGVVNTFVPFGRILTTAGAAALAAGGQHNQAAAAVERSGIAALVAGRRYAALADAMVAADVAQGRAAESARYTALAVQDHDASIRYAGGNLQEWLASIRDTDDALDGGGGGGGVAGALDKVNPRLARMTDHVRRGITALSVQVDAVKAATDALTGYADATRDAIAGGISLADVWDPENIAGSVQAFRDQIAAAATFSTSLAGLASALGNTPGALALIEQIRGLGAEAGNALLSGLTVADAQGLASTLGAALGTIGTNSTGIAQVFYGEGVRSAVTLAEGMADELARDEERLRKIGRQVGQPIGAEIKAEIAKAIAEATAAATAATAAATAATNAAANATTVVNITGATVIDPVTAGRAITSAIDKGRARRGGTP